MFNIILYQPEIPPNTGNIIRLCANTGANLHLIEPLGFTLDNARVKRAGLDYHEMATVRRYPGWPGFRLQNPDMDLWAFSSRAGKSYCRVCFQLGDGLVFGPETRGLPSNVVDEIGNSRAVRLPMRADTRSLNLSNSVAIALYEALRQNHFTGLN